MTYDHDEEWSMIPDCDNKYAVSNTGEIYSFHTHKFLKLNPVRKRKCDPNNKGYQIATIMKDGKRYGRGVHRFVAEAFLPIPQELLDQGYTKETLEINHIDEDPSNNDVSNLEWCTHEYNSRYGSRSERASEIKGIPVVSIDPETGEKKFYKSAYEAERLDACNNSRINEICNGTNHRHRGKEWRKATEEEIKENIDLFKYRFHDYDQFSD